MALQTRKRNRRKKIGKFPDESSISEETLFKTAEEVRAGKWGRGPAYTQRARGSDDVVSGLRWDILNTGRISLRAQYTVGTKRRLMDIGELNKDSEERISLDNARELTRVIQALGDKGIDVAKGGRQRLIRELLEQGTSWRLR